jgi:SAM-dependent methyltransferase
MVMSRSPCNVMRNLRFRLFYTLLHPFSDAVRRRRMESFVDYLGPDLDNPELRILDLGGQARFWNDLPQPKSITLLNLPGIHDRGESHHQLTYVEGDACNAPQFADQSFDIVFSNSVIEHVGGPDKQEQFAREALRIGRRIWIQTPSRYFPVEAHCGMPFWWFYPGFVRRWFLKRWRKRLPGWTDMVESTTVLRRRWLHRLFPDATIHTERFWGIPKCYLVMSKSE